MRRRRHRERETRKGTERTTAADAAAVGDGLDGAAVVTDLVARWRMQRGRGENARQYGGIGRETRVATERTIAADAAAVGDEPNLAAVDTDPVARWRRGAKRREEEVHQGRKRRPRERNAK